LYGDRGLDINFSDIKNLILKNCKTAIVHQMKMRIYAPKFPLEPPQTTKPQPTSPSGKINWPTLNSRFNVKINNAYQVLISTGCRYESL